MKDGFIKVGAVSPSLKVADCKYNGEQILEQIKKAEELGVKLLVFPELCISGATCGDLFFQDTLLTACENTLAWLLEQTEEIALVFIVGLPVSYENVLYNVAVYCKNGEILAVVPKTNLTDSDSRYFAKYSGVESIARVAGTKVPFGTEFLLKFENMEEFVISTEIGKDVYVSKTPSLLHTVAGATVICVPSAICEMAGRSDYRRELLKVQSEKLHAVFIYAEAGNDESTQDMVFSGHNIIAENGKILAESSLYEHGIIITEIDVKRLVSERRKAKIREIQPDKYWSSVYDLKETNTKLTRKFEKMPFVPSDVNVRKKRCEEIFMLQAMGLRKRLAHTNCKTAVIGLSGGLDSTLTLLVTAKAYDLLEI